MPTPLVWTEARDTLIRRLRGAGDSWDSIAAALQISRWAAIERGRRIGARKPVVVAAAARPAADHGRDPLPAGHPISWGAITLGTILEDAPYPYPPMPPAPVSGEIPAELIGEAA